MMVPKKSLILAGAALALLGASSSAQSQSGKVFARYNKPLRSVALDLETGTLTRGPAVHDKEFATCIAFDNIDLGGFVGVDTGNKFCEWYDAGVMDNAACPAGGNTNLITSIVFAYCSATQDVGSGGVGGSARLGFYEGYTVGGGAPVTTCVVFTLTGLPGNTADSSFFGGFRCYFILVTFTPLINCAKGPIGYSWHFMDLGRDGVLASTFPFLSCVQSCSGTGPDGKGMVDLIDEYCPSGSFPPRATFSFGTTPFGSYFTSMSMQIRKLVGKPCLVNQARGDNNCNMCGWKGVTKLPPVPAGQKYHAVDPGQPQIAACLGHSWNPQVILNEKGNHPPPSPNGGVHTISGPQLCTYNLFLGQATNGPCPANPFAPYNVRVELGVQGNRVLTIPGGIETKVTPQGTQRNTFIPKQFVAKDLAFLNVEWVCYVDIITGPAATRIVCRSQTLFGVVGAKK